MQTLMDAATVAGALRRMAAEVVAATGASQNLVVVGIQRGGVAVARRLAAQIAEERQSVRGRTDDDAVVLVGEIDIALYRDDAAMALPHPHVGPSSIPFPIGDRHVLVVDDVLQTGRTIRAAIDHLLDYGRPQRIWLAVLFDRGGRELPIAADFVGQRVDVPASARIEVRFDIEGAGAFLQHHARESQPEPSTA